MWLDVKIVVFLMEYLFWFGVEVLKVDLSFVCISFLFLVMMFVDGFDWVKFFVVLFLLNFLFFGVGDVFCDFCLFWNGFILDVFE